MQRKRKKAGRKPLPGGREKFTTTLPGYVVRHLRKIGDGNASQAICMLVDRDMERQKIDSVLGTRVEINDLRKTPFKAPL